MAHDVRSVTATYAEFPNDNPDLHRRVAERHERARLPSEDLAEPIEIVDELYFENAFDEAMDEPGAPAIADPFATFASLLERVAHTVGADQADVSLVRALLGLARMDDKTPPEHVVATLQAGDIVRRDARGIARTDRFTRQVQGWQGILRAESDDFGTCGAATLDEWASDLLARSFGDVSRAPTIRRELRRLGVAAFGLLATAA